MYYSNGIFAVWIPPGIFATSDDAKTCVSYTIARSDEGEINVRLFMVKVKEVNALKLFSIC
jgi:hypothetical protein